MSDEMKPQPFDVLLRWILTEYAHNASIFGIQRSLFYTPQASDPYATRLFDHPLTTPIGPAAGPHTQLTQNILCAWLCGGRFIELKTVQIMDALEIPRPCIDMADEGYNVEWSQELKLDQSIDEYVKAWVLVHVLRRLLGIEDQPFGTIFNMSVGYDLQGIQSPPMTRFMDRLQDASEAIAALQDTLQTTFPQFADLEIPSQITDNVTLSTMHGCPPDEIERIARYLLEERGLHTTVKLNPTLLGRETVLQILHDDLGFHEIHIPEAVFAQDLQYPRAVALIRAMQTTAAAHNLTFGVKLSNTLAMHNHKDTLPGDEMYMSGRALYPITMNLFQKLAIEFNGDLHVSYSAGAGALNVSAILAAGARPVTVASDLLKPGGYARFGQYLERLGDEMRARGAGSLDALAGGRLNNLAQAAAAARRDPRYKKDYHPYDLPKVASGLELFDCIAAPCVEQCAVRQDVPEYAWLIAQGQYARALRVILARNPLPGVTGYVCTHLCQTRCTRNNYDEPVTIRALKRFAFENGQVTLPRREAASRETQVAIVGSGPSGLAAAYFLALNGVQTTIYEAQDRPGGMLAIAPPFRLPPAVVQADIQRITDLGVQIECGHPVVGPPETLLEAGFDAVYVACGFPQDAQLKIEGIDGQGVYSALELLRRVAHDETPDLGEKVLVIGGGNTAMDATRTARRLLGRPVTVVYRRSQAEMPATQEELEGLLAEGNVLEELASPERVILADGRVVALECVRNRLGEPGPDGRRRPQPIPGSTFQIPADSVIVAIGQRPDVTFLDGSGVALRKNGAIAVEPESGQIVGADCTYAGGDAVRGPAIIIEACADGRRAAEAICAQLGRDFTPLPARPVELSDAEVQQVKHARARKVAQREPDMLPPAERDGFDLIEQTLSETDAQAEAARCLQCSTLCDKCVEVCPNRANYAYFVTPRRRTLPQLVCVDGVLIRGGEEVFEVRQRRQILHVDDLCNACGNCSTFCVHQGQPYLDKPRLFLQQGDFEREDENAFYLDGQTLWRRAGGQTSRLARAGDGWTFESTQVHLRLSADFDVQEMTLKQAFTGALSLRPAAEMALILDGITASLPFLVD